MSMQTTRQIILDHLRASKPETITQVAESLGITRPIASVAMHRMRLDGLIIVDGSARNKGGRRVSKYTAAEGKKELTIDDMVSRVKKMGGGAFGVMAAQLMEFA